MPSDEVRGVGGLAELHAFITQKALPLWAGAGIDARTGAFMEHLHLDGRPDPGAVRRMRVQARQIYVYCHASLLGLYDGGGLAVRAFERMLADYWQPDGGFILSVGPDGGARDRTQTAYDQAFGLLAMAWLHRLTGSAMYLDWATRTLAFMDAHLADARHGGYADSVGAGTRCQNPHMHLLEALLALYETSGDDGFLRRADTMHGMFTRHFLDRSIPALREFFDAEWHPDALRGDQLDPGHQLEWVWLLDRYRRHRPEAADDTGLLYQFATRHGIDRRDGLVLDEVMADGRTLRGTKRLWPQTEHLKAQVVRYESSPGASAAEIDRVCRLLMQRYMEPSGAWNDQVGADGERLSRVAPASSFYHLFLAYSEAMRVVTLPTPAIVPSSTSPGTTDATPSGVPVKTRSPGSTRTSPDR